MIQNNSINTKKHPYLKEILIIGIPVTLQNIFQASYSFVDQLMVGSLGTISIAGSGLGGKFSGLVTFTIGGIAAVASILISQYHGTNDKKGISKSFLSCLLLSLLIMACFALPSFFIPEKIMGIYTNDQIVINASSAYLKIIAISFFPMTVTMLVSSLFRSIEKSKYPMYISVIAIFTNIIFNYIFIFGKLGFPALGLAGAALGTLVARSVEAVLLIIIYFSLKRKGILSIYLPKNLDLKFYKKIMLIALPILLNEFSWSVGENIYAAIYGRLGTTALAAMSLTNPLQGMFIGMFTGLSSAAVVLVGKRLGQNQNEDAYSISKYLIKFGFVGSLVISFILIGLSSIYVTWFNIEPEVARTTIYIIYALAAVLFAKILNMILGGGIIRSGGNTHYTLITDLIGTWIFGVPLGLLTAFVFHLPIYWVYFILSLEEVVRLMMGFYIFRKKKWMRNIT